MIRVVAIALLAAGCTLKVQCQCRAPTPVDAPSADAMPPWRMPHAVITNSSGNAQPCSPLLTLSAAACSGDQVLSVNKCACEPMSPAVRAFIDEARHYTDNMPQVGF